MTSRHAYGPHHDQVGELRLPAGPGPFPVAVLVHGGGWSTGYDLTLMTGLALDLVAHGWAAWNLEYRRLGPRSRGGWPASGEDVLAGLDHLAALDAPLDLGRIVLVGHSAGGQLALWAAGRRAGAGGPVQVAGVAGQAAVSDLVALAGPKVAAYMGGMPDELPQAYADASPLARVPLGVPALLVHGEDDAAVPPDLSVRYAAAARAAGDDVELVLRPGEMHREHLDPRGGSWAVVRRWLARWERPAPGA